MHTAYGIISPKNKTAVTEIITAITAGIIPSKKIGNASIAAAFANSNVTNSQWCFYRIGSTRLAARISLSVPDFILISIVKSSIDRYPTVSPDIIPANRVSAMSYSLTYAYRYPDIKLRVLTSQRLLLAVAFFYLFTLFHHKSSALLLLFFKRIFF